MTHISSKDHPHDLKNDKYLSDLAGSSFSFAFLHDLKELLNGMGLFQVERGVDEGDYKAD